MQNRHETNQLKILLGKALQEAGLDPRLIDAFESGYITENALPIFNSWFAENYHELRTHISAHELNWADDFRRILLFLKNRTDLHLQQSLILQNAARILKNEGSTDEEFIHSLAQGHCAGFSVLVSYALWLEAQPKSDPEKPRDDWTWVSGVFNLLANWNPKKNYSAAQMADINRVIALIRGFQYSNMLEPVSQGTLVQAIDTQGRQFLKIFAIGSKFTDQEVQTLLDQIEELNPEIPDFQIMVGSHSHELSINRINGKYIFYDSNNIAGPLHVERSELALLISVSNAFSSPQSSPLCLAVFSRNNNLRFPDINNFLAKTEEVAEKKWSRSHINDSSQYTALHMAALIGSNESVIFLLAQGAPLNNRTTQEETALDLAIIHHHADVVTTLLESGAELNPVKTGKFLIHLADTGDILTLTALIQARGQEITAQLYNLLEQVVRENHGDIVDIILQYGPQFRPAEIKELAMVATQLDNAYALSMLIKHGADPFAIYQPRGENLLHYAVKHDRIDLVKLILQHLPPNQINTKRNDGLTALELARNPEIRTLLAKHAQTPSLHSSVQTLFTHTTPASSISPAPTDLKNKPK